MKKVLLGAVVLSAAFVSCNNTKVNTAVDLKTKNDSISYMLGSNIGQGLKYGKTMINEDILYAALGANLRGEEVKEFSQEELMALMGEFGDQVNKTQQEEAEKKSEENKKEGEEFLAKNKEKSGVITTESGLQYEIITEGTGEKPTSKSKVKCHYHGTLINGKVFDSSVERGEPTTFPVNGVIKGWTEALQLMPVGSKWKLYIPSSLGYGDRGVSQEIGPNSTLIFEVELLEILPAE